MTFWLSKSRITASKYIITESTTISITISKTYEIFEKDQERCSGAKSRCLFSDLWVWKLLEAGILPPISTHKGLEASCVQVKMLKNQFWVPFRPYSPAYTVFDLEFLRPTNCDYKLSSLLCNNIQLECTSPNLTMPESLLFLLTTKVRLWERVRLFIYYTVFIGLLLLIALYATLLIGSTR